MSLREVRGGALEGNDSLSGVQSEVTLASQETGSRWVLDAGRLRHTATVYLMTVGIGVYQLLVGKMPWSRGPAARLTQEILYLVAVVLLALSIRSPRGARLVAIWGTAAVFLSSIGTQLFIPHGTGTWLSSNPTDRPPTFPPNFIFFMLSGLLGAVALTVLVITVARATANTGARQLAYGGLAGLCVLTVAVPILRRAMFDPVNLAGELTTSYTIATVAERIATGVAIAVWLRLLARHADGVQADRDRLIDPVA